MTEGLAIEIAKHKMMELGVGDNYILRYRHFIILPESFVQIVANDELFILLNPNEMTKVESMLGDYDLEDIDEREHEHEVQYIHSRFIYVHNLSAKENLHAKFLQVIPKLI